MSTLRFVRIRGQGHCLTLDLGLSYYDNFKHLLKSHWPILTKFHVDPPGAGGNKKVFKLSRSHDQFGHHGHIW